MTLDRSKAILVLYVSVLVLLPFNRLAELPILILTILGVLGLFFKLSELKKDARFNLLITVYLSYLGMIVLSSFDSFWMDKTLMVSLFSLRFFLASIPLLLFVKTKHFAALFKSIALLTLLWAVDALFQYFTGYDLIGRASYEGRLNGIFGEHHVKLGPVLALLLPLTMIALIHHKSHFRWISIFLITIVIILSGTRSAWLMAMFAVFAYWLHHVKQRRLILLFKGLIVSVIMVISLWFISPEFKQRIERSSAIFQGTEQGIDFALADRLNIWQTSWEMIKEHPVNGVGAHAFRKAYPNYAQVDDVWKSRGGVGMHAHHWVLEILAETGIIGLLLMIFAIVKLMNFVKNNYHDHYSWAFLIGLICAFLPITSTYSIFASFWSICIWFIGVGLIVVGKKDD